MAGFRRFAAGEGTGLSGHRTRDPRQAAGEDSVGCDLAGRTFAGDGLQEPVVPDGTRGRQHCRSGKGGDAGTGLCLSRKESRDATSVLRVVGVPGPVGAFAAPVGPGPRAAQRFGLRHLRPSGRVQEIRDRVRSGAVEPDRPGIQDEGRRSQQFVSVDRQIRYRQAAEGISYPAEGVRTGWPSSRERAR